MLFFRHVPMKVLPQSQWVYHISPYNPNFILFQCTTEFLEAFSTETKMKNHRNWICIYNNLDMLISLVEGGRQDEDKISIFLLETQVIPLHIADFFPPGLSIMPTASTLYQITQSHSL